MPITNLSHFSYKNNYRRIIALNNSLEFTVNANLIPLNGDIRLDVERSVIARMKLTENQFHLNTLDYFLFAVTAIQLLAALRFRSGKSVSVTSTYTFIGFLGITYCRLLLGVCSSIFKKDHFWEGRAFLFSAAAIPLLILYYCIEGFEQVNKSLTLENSFGNKIVLTQQNRHLVKVLMQWAFLSEILTSLYSSLRDGEKEYYHFALAVMKAAALYCFTRGSWLTISRTYKTPLANRSIDIHKLGTKPTEIFKNSVQKIALYEAVYIPEGVSLFSTEDAFKTAAESLLQQGENFFDQSFWKYQPSGGTKFYDVLFKNTISKIGEGVTKNCTY